MTLTTLGSASVVPLGASIWLGFDFAGGTTDISPFCEVEGGVVVSASIDRYAHASLVVTPSEGIQLHSLDYDSFIEARDVRELAYDGNLDLTKAALRQLNLKLNGGMKGGMKLCLRSSAPPGSGLGSSAAMGVALLGFRIAE